MLVSVLYESIAPPGVYWLMMQQSCLTIFLFVILYICSTTPNMNSFVCCFFFPCFNIKLTTHGFFYISIISNIQRIAWYTTMILDFVFYFGIKWNGGIIVGIQIMTVCNCHICKLIYEIKIMYVYFPVYVVCSFFFCSFISGFGKRSYPQQLLFVIMALVIVAYSWKHKCMQFSSCSRSQILNFTLLITGHSKCLNICLSPFV